MYDISGCSILGYSVGLYWLSHSKTRTALAGFRRFSVVVNSFAVLNKVKTAGWTRILVGCFLFQDNREKWSVAF